MKFIVKIFILIILLTGSVFGWLVFEKALFYRHKIAIEEQAFLNGGLRITNPKIIRGANFPHLGVLLGGNLFYYWFNPIDDNWQLVNYGGIEEGTTVTYDKLIRAANEIAPEFVVINAGFCQIRTTIHNNHDATQAIDSIMHNLHLMTDVARSHGIIAILTTLAPVRRAYMMPYSGLIELPSSEKSILNNSIQILNARIIQLAREKNLPLMDFHRVLVDDTGLLRKEYSLTDGEHLNWEAYQVLSNYFIGEVTSIIQANGEI